MQSEEPAAEQASAPPAVVVSQPKALVSPRRSAVLAACRAVREQPWRFAVVSILLLVPCLWHRQIEATDLGSHLYNAWLTHLIHEGKLHGLWIGSRWNNVLFDWLLSGLCSHLGFLAAQRIAVSAAVLIFFWGTFAMTAAAATGGSVSDARTLGSKTGGAIPWHVLPIVAMFTYGYTFHMGFFNYYISLGLSFFGVALFWRGGIADRVLAFALAPLIVLAHPLGLAWLAGACAWIACAEKLKPRYDALLLGTATSILLAAHEWLSKRYIVEWPPKHFVVFGGADQLYLFGRRYWIVLLAFLAFAMVAIGADLARRLLRSESAVLYRVPLQLYVLAELAAAILPRGIRFPGYECALALLTDRLTSVSAAMLCCLLALAPGRRWRLLASLGIAAVFFGFTYRDTGIINRIEAQADQLVQTIPAGSRLLATILYPGSRIRIHHIADRACIGRCFSYGDYEPSTRMFRVRAAPGNSFVMSNYDDTVAMEGGEYTVKAADLPAWQIYQCDPSGNRLCIRGLKAGEENGRLDVYPRAWR